MGAVMEGFDAGSGGAEEERLVQAGWCFEHEAEEEARAACAQGREPVHEGALCLQGEASFEDGEGAANEEAEGDDQLSSGADCIALRRAVATRCVGGWSHQAGGALYFLG